MARSAICSPARPLRRCCASSGLTRRGSRLSATCRSSRVRPWNRLRSRMVTSSRSSISLEAAEVEDSWSVGGRTFASRLIVGTGKYKSFEENAAAVEASVAEIVTVAVRRVNIADPKQPMLTDFIDPKKFTYLPNTAGCFTGEEAIRTLRLGREAGGWTPVKQGGRRGATRRDTN